MDIQQTLFDELYEDLKITKPIRLIELFAGYGSQSLALHYLKSDYESHRICEWNYKSFHAYRYLHDIDIGTDYSEGHSDDEITEFLMKSGISADWNKPMNPKQIMRLPISKKREIYSDIIATHNLVDVSKAHAESLGMDERDKYCYVMTYSFPCQDLSLAGKGKGMSEGSGTRSGLLWEVERILRECKQNKPDILLMENVTQVHNTKNDKDWQRWMNSLEDMGYKNYWKDMIATDYGIPQKRNRCFMVSVLGNYNYTFPKPHRAMKESLKMKDFLEDGVDKKYYLSPKMIDYISKTGTKTFRNADCRINLDNARPITTCPNKRAGATNYIDDELPNNFDLSLARAAIEANPTLKDFLEKEVDEKYYLTEKQIDSIKAWNDNYDKGLPIMEATKKGYAIANEGDGVYFQNIKTKRETVQHGKIQTLKTSPDVGVVVDEPSIYSIDEQNKRIHHNGTIGAIVTDSSSPKHNNRVGIGLRIRRLTPRECFRLMGVRDEDFDKIKDQFADATLYHLAGDSIVVNVLMAIFEKMYLTEDTLR